MQQRVVREVAGLSERTLRDKHRAADGQHVGAKKVVGVEPRPVGAEPDRGIDVLAQKFGSAVRGQQVHIDHRVAPLKLGEPGDQPAECEIRQHTQRQDLQFAVPLNRVGRLAQYIEGLPDGWQE